ncbi:9275_t:CDS:2, partial [Cetraspora pellucida]
ATTLLPSLLQDKEADRETTTSNVLATTSVMTTTNSVATNQHQ